MNRVSVACISVLACGVLSGAGGRESRTVRIRDSRLMAETVRLRAHFDSVDLELRARKTSLLTPDQRARRNKLISWLRDYRNADRFPINDRYPDRAVPFFRDSRGTLCAMAYLIDRSGRSDLVDRVARTRNNALIPELADDPALADWFATWGLSVAEAARIQPSYNGGVVVEDQRDRVHFNYAVTSLALGAASVGLGTVNFVAPKSSSGILGIVIGATDIVLGVHNIDRNPGTQKLSITNISIGAASMFAGLRGLLASNRSNRVERKAEMPQPSSMAVRLSPDVIVSSGAPRIGLLASARF
jgi:hypothetical protein